MNESSLPPLRDLPPGRLEQRAAHLRSEIADKHQARLRVARPVLVALIAAVAALAIVPIGGASLGQRAVDGVTSLWETPPNQDALDAAAADAQSVAGDAYYTAAAVNDAGNTVDVYLANAPQSIIDQLQATHPGTYVIHNDAAHPLSQLLRLQHALKLGPLQTAAGSVNIVASDPTLDGHLKVGIEGNGDVEAAQKALDALYGPQIVEVYGGAQLENNLMGH
jgi:hypothetical protein